MSIIRKVRNTEEYRKKLESLPQSTRNNKIDAADKAKIVDNKLREKLEE